MTNEYPKRFNADQVKNYVKSVDWVKRLDREIPFLNDLFSKHNYKEICDFGCGPGMHANRLAKNKKFTVTGVDIDEQMIAYASLQSQVTQQSNLSFIQGNFLEPTSAMNDLQDKFDVLYTLGNALMIIWTNAEPIAVVTILKKLGTFIKSGGGLFFQILNSDNPRNGFVVSKISQNESGENQILVKHFLPVENKLYTDFTNIKWQNNNSAITVSDSRKGYLKLVPLDQLKKYLEEAGFSNPVFYENYNGDLLKQDSDALMCFAIKK